MFSSSDICVSLYHRILLLVFTGIALEYFPIAQSTALPDLSFESTCLKAYLPPEGRSTIYLWLVFFCQIFPT
jgi:hypothetical protein